MPLSSIDNVHLLHVSSYGLYWDGYAYDHGKIEARIKLFKVSLEAIRNTNCS